MSSSSGQPTSAAVRCPVTQHDWPPSGPRGLVAVNRPAVGNHGSVTDSLLQQPVNWSYLMDMDGVLVHEEHLIPGADAFIAELTARGTNFVVVTNNPIYTRRD